MPGLFIEIIFDITIYIFFYLFRIDIGQPGTPGEKGKYFEFDIQYIY